MWIPPLLILPLIIYNLVAFDIVGSQDWAWAEPVFSLNMPSGAIWSMNVSDMLVVFALTLLLIDTVRSKRVIFKATNVIGAIVIFAIYGVEFLLVPAAATSVFFACTVMSFVDVVVKWITPAAPRPIELPRFEDE